MLSTQTPPTRHNDVTSPADLNRFPARDPQHHGKGAKADAALRHEVERHFCEDAVFKALEYDHVDVRVSDGIVYLYGHVSSLASRQRAERLIQAIPGLLGIQNHLVADDKLVMEVAATLGSLENSYDCKFFTGATHGVVEDEILRLLAEKSAAANPDVRGVVNGVRVRNAGLGLRDQPFMQPAIGEQIFFLDGVSGRVKQVIINPDNRRVVAMILQAGFMNRQQELKTLNAGQTASPERSVVLAMDLIRFLTRDSGFLYISSNDKKRYLEFDPSYFFAPKKDWKAPYPYRPADVLLPARQPQDDLSPEQRPRSLFEIALEEQSAGTTPGAGDLAAG